MLLKFRLLASIYRKFGSNGCGCVMNNNIDVGWEKSAWKKIVHPPLVCIINHFHTLCTHYNHINT